MAEHTEFDAAFNAAAALAQPQHVDIRPFVIVPEKFKVEDLGYMLPNPPQAIGNIVLHDADSFIAVVNDHKREESRIYLDGEKFVAVIDESTRDLPGWRRNRATYACPLSPEWKAWTGKNGQRLTQEQFAQFVEDNLSDVATPPAAEMLEISRSLEAKKNVNFASGIRLSNGQNELTYEETISGTAGRGKLAVPEEFVIGIPVFVGGPSYAVVARLRYRITSGNLQMWFDLVRPHKIVEDAINEVSAYISAKTEAPVLKGAA